VQIHTDGNAAQVAREANARALTVGNHIAFDSGEYQPGTLVGDALLAHELAHTVQQRGASADSAAKGYAPEESAEEMDADKAAVGAVVARSLGLKGMLTRIPAEVLPRLRTGLRLRRCKKNVDMTIAGVSDTNKIAPDVATAVDVTITENESGVEISNSGAKLTVEGSGGDNGNASLDPTKMADTGQLTVTGTDVTVVDATPLKAVATGTETVAAESPEFAVQGVLKDDLQFMAAQGIGSGQLIKRIQIASDSEKEEALNDGATRGSLRGLGQTDQIAVVDALINLSSLPAGKIHDAAALLLLSESAAGRNTTYRLLAGDLTAYYIEDLDEPDNADDILTAGNYDPSQYDLVDLPGEGLVPIPHIALGFNVPGSTDIYGRNSASLDRWMTILTHEGNHALNTLPANPTAVDYYRSEFRAYWVAEFANIVNEDDRAEAVKDQILNSGVYPYITEAYNTDPDVQAEIDAITRPDGNLTND
jgi:hypothetical protein